MAFADIERIDPLFMILLGQLAKRRTMGTLKVAFLSSFAMELIAMIGTAMVAVEVGLRLLADQMSFLEALICMSLAGEFYLPLRSLGSQFHTSMEVRVALAEIWKISDIHLPPLSRSPRGQTRLNL